MKSTSYSLTDEAELVVAADNVNRTIYLQITGNNPAYVGGADVSSTNGLPYEKHTSPHTVFIPQGEALYAVCAEGETEDLRVLTPDAD